MDASHAPIARENFTVFDQSEHGSHARTVRNPWPPGLGTPTLLRTTRTASSSHSSRDCCRADGRNKVGVYPTPVWRKDPICEPLNCKSPATELCFGKALFRFARALG